MKRFQFLLLLLGALSVSGCFFHHDDDDDDFTVVASTVEIEPNDESASPHFLGVLRHFEEMRVSGAADATFDEFDGFAIALTKESEIEFQISFDDLAGELDVWVYDPAVNDIVLFFEDDFSPDQGIFEVRNPVLDFQIIVRAFTGTSSYNLTILARPIPFFSAATSTDGNGLDTGRASGVQSSLVKSDHERSLAPVERQRALTTYLGRPVVTSTAGFAEGPVRNGTFLAISEKGEVAAAPIFELRDGQRVIRFDEP